MDIRKFFAKADGKKKHAATTAKNKAVASSATTRTTTTATAASNTTSSSSSNTTPTNASRMTTEAAVSKRDNKKKSTKKNVLQSQDRVEVSKEEFFAQAATEAATGSSSKASVSSSPSKKHKHTESDWVQVSEEGSPSPAKKRRQQQQQDWVQVSKSEAESVNSSEEAKVVASNTTESSSTDDSIFKPSTTNESALVAPSKRKRKLVIDDNDEDEDDEDEMPIKKASSRSRTNERIIADDDDDDDDDDDNDDEDYREEEDEPTTPKAKKATPKKTPANKRAKKSTTTPSSSSSASKRKSKKEEHRASLIRPGVKVKSFSTDDAVPECLSGTTFVFSGVLRTMSRESSEDFVKILGGRVTSAVSGKTDYLVVGDELEDGRPYTDGSKYKKAMENDVIIVRDEEQLFGLVKQYSDRARTEKPATATPDATSGGHDPVPIKPAPAVVAKVPPVNPYAKKPTNPYAKTATTANSVGPVNPYASKSPSSSPDKPQASVSDIKFNSNSLWADKYAPQSTREVLGNQENVKKLANWLDRWEHTFNNPKAHGKTFSSPNGPWKAALISGPPGIGKTTSATLVANASGRDLLEFNASDTRSKKTMSQGMGDVTGSHVLDFGTGKGGGTKKATAKKRVIIMDEVDGMGAGDRSGMAELIKMIKGSRVPIICICNDRQSPKVKSLLPYCLDLRYRRPTKSVIARRAVQIGQKEGMRIELNAAEAIAESCGNDIRQVLNCLQMWASSKGASMTYKELKEREGSINKDEILRVSMFDATKLIVEGRMGLVGADAKAERDSIFKRSDAYFVDYSLMGLMVHQNYPKILVGRYAEAKRANSEDRTLQFLEEMHDATAAMSDYAVAENAVRSGDQNWSLLPFAAMMCVKTGYHAGGETGGFLSGFPEFAGWMGKNSTRGKKNRQLQELGHHMNYKISGDSTELRLSYLPMLRDRFTSLLTSEDGAKPEEAIQLMDEYGLDRDDVFENLDEFKMDSKAKALSSLLDSKQKAAFTRAYNAGSHKSQALVDEQGSGTTRRKKASNGGADPTDPDVVDDDKQLETDDEGDDEEEEARKAMEKFIKKGAKKGGKKKNSTTKKSKSKGKK